VRDKPLKMSLKKMKELQQELGGRANGFFITAYGVDSTTGKTITIDKYIAVNVRPNASADTYLVKGKEFKSKY